MDGGMKLLQTTKTGRGKASHFHFAYLNEKEGRGITSLDNKHVHEIIFIPPVEPTTDPMTAAPVPGSPPRWEITPHEEHTHDLVEIKVEEKKEKKEDKDIVREVHELWKQADAIEADSRKKAEESEKFYAGEQWKKTDKDTLEKNDRAALTINEIESKIDLLSGYQRQNRSDMRFYPVEDGDGRIADIINVVVKNITDQNDYEFSETDAFEDAAITGRGNLHCYADYSKNIKGDIVIEHFPWREVRMGPHRKKDGSDCEYLIKDKWFSLGKAKQLWPDKAEEITADFALYNQVEDHIVYAHDQFANSENAQPSDMSSFVNIAKKEIRVLECERKEFKRIPIAVDVKNDFYMNLEGLSKTGVSAIKTIPELRIIEKPESKVRRHVTAAMVLLEDDYLDEEDFSILSLYAKKRDDNWWGKVEGVKDPQKEINKRHSQLIDIVNKVATYGFIYDSGTFPSKEAMEKFKAGISKPGYVLEVNNVNSPPKESQGVKFPTELANVISLDSQKIKEIMNINLEMAGMARASQSGIAIVEQKRQGLIGNEFLFDNLNAMKKKLGRKLVRLIQKVYTPERILRILMNRNAQKPVDVGGKPLSQYDPKEILALLKNADLMKYDLTVGESAFNPTTRMANFVIWSELAGRGVGVPPAFLLDLSDLPEKDKAKQMFAETEKQKQQQENMKVYMELGKSLIAKGGLPPMPGTQAPA